MAGPTGTERREDIDCLVVGAGPGGLGVAAELRRRGVRAVVLERGAGVAERWRGRYDRLKINTSTLTAYPPGGRFPLRYGTFPTRDQLVRHYERYARANGIDVRTRTEVRRVDRSGDGWVVRTGGGDLGARTVVVATGKDGAPHVPPWPGRDRFGGPIVHSGDYRNARPFAGRRALVVGAGSSALDICIDLVEGGAASVALSIRTPPHLTRRAVGGFPSDLVAIAISRLPRPAIDRIAGTVRRLAYGDLSEYGLPLPDDSFAARVLDRGMIPTVDPGAFVPALKRGAVRVVPAIERLEEGAAVLAGGAREPADAVIAATGYGRGLEPLVGHLGVLDERGNPVTPPGTDPPGAPGLHFIGFTDVLTGNLRQLRLDAKRVASAVASGAGSPAPAPGSAAGPRVGSAAP
jgi:cation diffusion facilitator CzcD-associated flavoprotein CzcO